LVASPSFAGGDAIGIAGAAADVTARGVTRPSSSAFGDASWCLLDEKTGAALPTAEAIVRSGRTARC